MSEDGPQANAHEMTALEWVAYCSLVYVVCGTAYRAVKMMFSTTGLVALLPSPPLPFLLGLRTLVSRG
jgi:hypothetical protein